MSRSTQEIISQVGVVSDLGVYLDDELSMKQHVNRIAATCFFHLHHLRQIRRHIGRDLTVHLIIAFIMTRFDYCNSVLAGLSQTTLAPLQHVQNAAVRLVLALRGCEDVTPFLIQLHWLPVRWRIYFKLCTIMHTVHTGRCPAYLKEIVHTVNSTTVHPGLRSAVSTDYVVPRLCMKFCKRSFYAGPVAWNSVHVQYTSKKRDGL